MSDLLVVLGGRVAGAVTHAAGRPRYTYLDDYASEPEATPLSLSMPVAPARTYDHRTVSPWLMNLLPDDANVRENLARQLGVRSWNAIELLGHIGRDCAGAVQLVAPEDLNDVLGRDGGLEQVTAGRIGDRLRALLRMPQQWIGADERWSLAGAQSKFAVVRTADGEWAYAHGNAASTHIVKPGIARFPDQALNEHLCLRALAAVGISSAVSEFTEFDGVPALVVERYDRLTGIDGRVIRLHQEDLCQALSVPPERKYPSDGGPAATHIARLLAREATATDVDRFADIVIAQYLLGAPDAHAKNYSIILNGLDAVLAPCYDVASSLPYDPDPGSALSRVAMPIGGRARFGEVTLHHVAKFARAVGTDPDRLIARTRELVAALPEALSEAGGIRTAEPPELRARLTRAVAVQCATIDTTTVRRVVPRAAQAVADPSGAGGEKSSSPEGKVD
ncbi:type II toxin-antitoxin system HipA family toxin [Nocardia speluncae]|uniref:Type II toxin-antitoxin system HipA family toxin n=1 Tax=Nocardia speluncae TaxID=419477 RepID=A0A846XK64_9NOCA|nr:type II toxin-antitoxin system HipA family toxin [Nocardia speluncae]NKY35046.1 type II toxin-antitoxin system HipA family toxin [Nocardia speluncae]